MIARRFTSVVWVAAIGGAALSCYILSAKVAEERTGLAQLEQQIQRTERSIQTLKTEIGTRGRVHQLQHWASADFGFAAPTASQFIDDEVSLASLQAPTDVPAIDAPMRMAAAPAAAQASPRVVQASAPAAAPQRPAVRQASNEREGEPMLRRAAVTSETAPRGPIQASARAPRDASATPTRRSASLVNESTLRDLDSRARSERGSERTSGRPR